MGRSSYVFKDYYKFYIGIFALSKNFNLSRASINKLNNFKKEVDFYYGPMFLYQQKYIDTRYRPFRIDLGIFDFGLFSSKGLLLYVYYDTFCDTYYCIVDSGFKQFIHTSFSFFGVPYKVKQCFMLTSSFLKVDAFTFKYNKVRMNLALNFKNSFFFFFNNVLNSLSFNNHFNFYSGFVGLAYDFSKKFYKVGFVNVIYIYLLQFLTYRWKNIKYKYSAHSAGCNSLSLMRVNVNNVVASKAY